MTLVGWWDDRPVDMALLARRHTDQSARAGCAAVAVMPDGSRLEDDRVGDAFPPRRDTDVETKTLRTPPVLRMRAMLRPESAGPSLAGEASVPRPRREGDQMPGQIPSCQLGLGPD